MKSYLIVFLMSLIGTLSWGSQVSEQSHSTLSISEHSAEIEIQIEMKKGWYTYAEDPGEVGQSVSVEWGGSDLIFGALKHPISKVKDESGFKVNVIEEFGIWTLPFKASSKGSKGKLVIRYLVCKDICVPQVAKFDLNIRPGRSDLSIFRAVFFAFLGGLILNIMPCVFPVLFLKVLSLSKAKDFDNRQRYLAFVGYATGIVLTFLALAILLWILKVAGLSIGWGFHLQSPIFIFFLAVIFLVVSLNLAGFVEIPATVLSGFGKWTSRLSKSDSDQIFLSNLNTGILATIVATPCTAPLMAPAIGYAFTVSLPIVCMVFTALGLGMALPYGLAVMLPSIVNQFPKPGQWMETAKKVMSIPMLITCLWLLFVLKNQIHIAYYVSIMGGLILVSFWIISKSSLRIKGGVVVLGILVTLGISFSLSTKKMEHQYGAVSQIKELIQPNKVVFVDVTADWCLSCKANEFLVLNTRDIRLFFEDQSVEVVILDWTQYDPEITKYLESFQRNGVPLYVVYKPGRDPIILPQLLTKDIVKSSILD